MAQTYNELIRTVTEDYLGGIDMDSIPSPSVIEGELLQATNNAIQEYNLGPRDQNAPIGAKLEVAYPDQKPPGERLKKLKELLPLQIALAIKQVHHAKLICWAADEGDGNYDVGVYQSEGEAKGVYDTRSDNLTRLIRRYDATISKRNVDEVVAILRAVCEVVSPCTKPDLVAVNNGLYDYGNKILMDFDPELVFTSKIGTDFVEDAPNPVIRNNEDGTDWDVVTWMDELSDDPKVVELLWQVLGAVVRPNVDWNKSAWLYSTLGNNGKGTFCTLARNLCGKGAWASIPIKAFGDDFKLESLTRVSAIITDENDTGTYLDDAAALKSIITGDPFLMNRKFKDPRSVKFRGFMIQCINSLPKLRDKSESLHRRLLVIPFEKRFEGCERKYIKGDYLNRPEVLEYVLHRILAKTDYYELDAPEATCRLLAEYREVNDPVRQFLDDILPQVAWDLLPWQFLHDLYRHWSRRNNPSGRVQSKQVFIKEVKALLPQHGIGWSSTQNPVRAPFKMDWPEPLIWEYDVTEWMNRAYRGSDPDRACVPASIKERYEGLVRDVPQGEPQVNPQPAEPHDADRRESEAICPAPQG